MDIASRPERARSSLGLVLGKGLFRRLPAEFAAWRRHGSAGEKRALAWIALHRVTPEPLRALYRKLRGRHERLGEDLRFRGERKRAEPPAGPGEEQARHARSFTSGMLSFAHEVHGQIALSKGVEPRSPFSDRRMIEFAVRMPLEAKLFGPWYKLLLRKSMVGILPESVRWRRKIEGHPGWHFHEQLVAESVRSARSLWGREQVADVLARWVDVPTLERTWRRHERNAGSADGGNLFRLALLAAWLNARMPTVNPSEYPNGVKFEAIPA